VNPISWVQGLEGVALIILICGLLFIEEVGVPLPFAPGDLILAIGGIAIAGGRVNPVWLVGAVAVATLLGAVLGREIFALLGWNRLMRVAEPLRARKPLEHASRLLHRGGWRAVFTARLIPGLRVHTTQVAGVSHMHRRTFIAGLVPATAVYIAAFVGLGAAFGRPILGLIREAEHQVLVIVALIVALLILFLLTRAPVRRALASLYAAGWTGPLKFSLESVDLRFVLAAIGLNFAGHTIAVTLKLPLFLDSTGTVLAGVMAGPWIGGSVGFVSNLVSSNTVDPIAAPYALISFAVGFAAGLARYVNWQQRLSGWISLWLVIFAIAAVASTPLNLLISDGKSGVGLGDTIFAALNGLLPRSLASLVGEAAVDLPDKLITVVAALLIAQGRLMTPRQTTPAADVDLLEVLTFVSRSPRWMRKLLIGSVCVLFCWLLVPYLLLSGYLIELARRTRAGEQELPPWNRRWAKLKEGFRINVVLVVWNLPTLLLSIPAGIVSSGVKETPQFFAAGFLGSLAGIVAAIGSLWTLVVLLLEPPIFTQYLDGGIRRALNLPAVIRRMRVNVGLSIVVGALVIVLTTLGLIGAVALVVGVLVTLPYAAFIGAYLVGYYARATDRRLGQPAKPLLREAGRP
jgi:energy-coupling factor transport system substrate-specific component